ncbi:hypothetical protein BGZ61DRAFT_545804 [Ilyonectria robusta]|uniref:uncharacterized protein n=1 Tax=Ilyonectria robusta TaxID=1079257 RepID=UPI001E8E6E89|nr:uncharacterized protein BGZ61DRAFT_545804 [Ilyonectria robusta]KAH8650435.1 hypothetical protein BGZ61DRAFT_545804 [Ilyonectria robusta]
MLVFRSYRMDADVRENVTGIRLKKKQVHFLELIWNHDSLLSSDSEHSSIPIAENGGDAGALNAVEEWALDNQEEKDEGEIEDEEDSDVEIDADWREEEAREMSDGAAENAEDDLEGNDEPHLVELVLGLSLSLYTETLTDSRPSSALLIYFSGILGFSRLSRAFLPARSYMPHLSGLIYIQRLLFLEMAIPLRAYPFLGISRRPRTEQLERLELIRKRYMVVGSQSAFEEMISLRNYGRVIARSDTPAFLLRWSDNGQTVSYGDSFRVSMTEFRLLGNYITQQAETLCTELMYDWDPVVDLAKIKDDITNTEKGFSFVLHLDNHLKDAHLALCERACTTRRNGLSRGGNWDWKAVFRYLRKEEAMCNFLLLGMSSLGGQTPRWPDLSSLWCVNGEFTLRGIYVYNKSMVFVVRHHKAKASTNREFIVAPFLTSPIRKGPCNGRVFWSAVDVV